MKAELIPNTIHTIVWLHPDGIYRRVGKWYTRYGDAQRVLNTWWCGPDNSRKDYYVMSFEIKEGELIENSNS